jgi:four helix bundle protein
MIEKAINLQNRSKKYAVNVVRYFRTLPKTDEARILGKQVLRSATSVAANYRAVCRARSRAEFISKLGTVVEEADESLLWFEIMSESEVINPSSAHDLMKESEELLRIFSSSLSTAKLNSKINETSDKKSKK